MNEEQKQTAWMPPLIPAVRMATLALAAGLLFSCLSPVSARAAGHSSAVAAAAAPALTRTVIPLGRTVGIKLFSDGVMVVGLSEIPSEGGPVSPARSCGLRAGDIITHINTEQVDSIEQVQALLQTLGGAQMSLRILRAEKPMQLTAQAVQCSSDSQYKLGAWIRDSMAGIGTMTFYDPASGIFGALGHGINDIDTALLMPLQSGSIMPAEIVDVKRGSSGTPGELHGTFEVDRDLGLLYANTNGGIFGILEDPSFFSSTPAVEIASRSEVRVGPATILSNISGTCVEEFSIEICRVYPASGSETRDLMIQVTDRRLLEATGGIVQGMSGSPILQNGKLVGAVTHVLVNNPVEGYGILAEQMLSKALIPDQSRIA